MKICTSEQYRESLRNRNLNVYLMGEKVSEPQDHPIILPSVNAVAATYDLAEQEPELASAYSPFTGERVNRFLHVAQSRDDLVMQNKMQRRLGQMTGTCFQRCVGMDAFNALHSVTYDIDGEHDTVYHENLCAFITRAQRHGWVVSGAMTDVKGDRSKPPHQQADPDLYVRVVRRDEEGVYISGAKAHQTGCINSHWMIVMPTARLGPKDRAYAISGAIPIDADGITYVYGRQSCDTRSLEASDIDQGNALFGGQEALVIFEEVFIPNERIFMDGEYAHAAVLVERFSCYHRRSYVCTSGVGDTLIGAAARIAECNGVENSSHIRDKIVEMTHLNETIYSTGIAASYQAEKMDSGVYQCDDMIANVCKHHVTQMPYQIARLAQDLAGGFVTTLPSAMDLDHEELGPLLRKYLKGRADIDSEERIRILRYIENLTMGRNAVGYLTESLHGAGSPQAQRIQIARQSQLGYKKRLATRLAGITDAASPADPKTEGGYMARVFSPESLAEDSNEDE